MAIDPRTGVSKGDLVLFRKIQMVMRHMTEPDSDEPLCFQIGDRVIAPSSHHLARAFSDCFAVRAVHGRSPDHENPHSWLVTGTGNIIDLLPVGIVGGPLLFDTYRHPNWNRIYMAATNVEAMRVSGFTEEVWKVTNVICDIMERHGIEIARRKIAAG